MLVIILFCVVWFCLIPILNSFSIWKCFGKQNRKKRKKPPWRLTPRASLPLPRPSRQPAQLFSPARVSSISSMPLMPGPHRVVPPPPFFLCLTDAGPHLAASFLLLPPAGANEANRTFLIPISTGFDLPKPYLALAFPHRIPFFHLQETEVGFSCSTTPVGSCWARIQMPTQRALPALSRAEPSAKVRSRWAPPSPGVIPLLSSAQFCESVVSGEALPWRRHAGPLEEGRPAAVVPWSVLVHQMEDQRPQIELTPSGSILLKSPWFHYESNPWSLAVYVDYVFCV